MLIHRFNFIALVIIIFTSCQNNEAINLVKQSKISSEVGALGFFIGDFKEMTVNEWCNSIAQKNPNNRYSWQAESTKEQGILLVSFEDEEGYGYRWEANLNSKIVIYVNSNEYLSRKYGLTRLDDQGNFSLSNIDLDTLRVFKNEIDYKLKCNIVNKTDKIITSAEVSGTLKIIFKDKTIEGKATYYSGFSSPISKNVPWNPNTEREVSIVTKSLEKMYLNYTPEYVLFELGLDASDPIGFSYDRIILEKDLLDEWEDRQKGLN